MEFGSRVILPRIDHIPEQTGIVVDVLNNGATLLVQLDNGQYREDIDDGVREVDLEFAIEYTEET